MFRQILLSIVICFAVVILDAKIVVCSKRFTESYILAEIAVDALRDAGIDAEHRLGMGGMAMILSAMEQGEIDICPDYSKNISIEVFKILDPLSLDEISKRLTHHGLKVTDPLGFNNTYSFVMRRDFANKNQIATISDLARFPDLRFGFNPGFLAIPSGWKDLSRIYNLPQKKIESVEHHLAFEALKKNSIDLKEAYTTDPELLDNTLISLIDNKHFFQNYDAVYLYRSDLPEAAAKVLSRLAGKFNEQKMRHLNAEAARSGDYRRAARMFFGQVDEPMVTEKVMHIMSNITHWTTRHAALVLVSLLLAITIGIPLGLLASKQGIIGHAILTIVGMLQSFPSLVMLTLLASLSMLGISAKTSIIVMAVYSLLPIVRNTANGIQNIPIGTMLAAESLGLKQYQRMAKIYVPIASPNIISGIKSSASINVGNATLAALIGMGGLGEPVLSGLTMGNTSLIMQGVIPTVILAIVLSILLNRIESWIVPRGLIYENLH